MSSVVVVTQEENPSFLTDNIDLKKLHKELSKVSKEAIDVLLACLKSQDERLRMSAATKLLEFQVTVSKEINTDQMQRLIAEIKLNHGPKGRLTPLDGEEEEKPRPIVDFSNIRSIE